MESIQFSREENIGFWKNLILVTAFFIVTPLTLGISLFSLYSLKNSTSSNQNLISNNSFTSPQSGVKVYASLPMKFPTVSEQITSADARTEILRQYMEEHASPLAPYAELVVETADKYSLDFRLITAIARQESNICRIIPPESFNCWGWGIHSKGSLGFTSFPEGIEEVSKGLRNEYLNKDYSTIEKIMSKYTPQSNGSWAVGVNAYMTEMQ